MLRDTKPVKFYRERAEALAFELARARAADAEHRAAVAKLAGERDAAQEMAASASNDYARARSERDDLEEKCAGLNRGVEALRSKLKLARGRCDVLEGEFLDTCGQLDVMKTRFLDAHAGMEKATKRVAELEADDRDLAALRRRLATKQAENHKLLTEVHRLKAAIRAQQAGFDVIKTTKADEANAAALIAIGSPEDASHAG